MLKIAILRVALLSLLFSQGTTASETVSVYFGTAQDGGIHHALFNEASGQLSPPERVADIPRAGFIAIHPGGQYLYATTQAYEKPYPGGVAAFKINPDHSLTLLNTQPTEGRGTCHVNVDRTGHTLMATNYGSRNIAAFSILEDGSLMRANSVHQHEGAGEHPRRQKKSHPHSIFPNPANTYAYVPDLGIDKIMIYQLNPVAATLTPAGQAEVSGGAKGPRHLKFSADGRFAYVLNELSLEVSVFEADAATGELIHHSTVSTLGDRSAIEGMSGSEIRIHPNGKFIYTANRDVQKSGRDSITSFAVKANGALELLANTPAEVSIPRNFNISPSGQWMLVGGQASNDISIFRVDSTSGTLSFTGQKIPFEGRPICIEFR